MSNIITALISPLIIITIVLAMNCYYVGLYDYSFILSLFLGLEILIVYLNNKGN